MITDTDFAPAPPEDIANPLTPSIAPGVIPDSSPVNPLLTELYRPAEIWQQKQRERFAAWRQNAFENSYAAAKDFDGFVADRGLKLNLDFAPTPEEAKQQQAAAIFLDAYNDGKPIPGGDLGRMLFIDRVAQNRFGVEGGVGGDATKLLPYILKEGQQYADNRELEKTLRTDAAGAAADPIKSNIFAFQAWRQTQSGQPAYNPQRDDAYYDAFSNTFNAVRERIDPILPQLREVIAATGNDEGGDAAQKVYSSLTPEQRPLLLQALAAYAQGLPEKEKEGFFANLAESARRAGSCSGSLESPEKGGKARKSPELKGYRPSKRPGSTYGASLENEGVKRRFCSRVWKIGAALRTPCGCPAAAAREWRAITAGCPGDARQSHLSTPSLAAGPAPPRPPLSSRSTPAPDAPPGPPPAARASHAASIQAMRESLAFRAAAL